MVWLGSLVGVRKGARRIMTWVVIVDKGSHDAGSLQACAVARICDLSSRGREREEKPNACQSALMWARRVSTQPGDERRG